MGCPRVGGDAEKKEKIYYPLGQWGFCGTYMENGSNFKVNPSKTRQGTAFFNF